MVSVLAAVVLFCHGVLVENYQDFCHRIPQQTQCLRETPRLQVYHSGMWVMDLGWFVRKNPMCSAVVYYDVLPKVILGDDDSEFVAAPSSEPNR